MVAANDASSAWIDGADYTTDGVDDDVQIQAAIDDLPAAGGTVLLSDGTFHVAASGLSLATGVRLVGQGIAGTVIKLQDGEDGRIVSATTLSNVTLEHITFDGNGANQSEAATRNDHATMFFTAMSHLRINECQIKNTYAGAGVVFAGTSSSNVLVTKCIFDTNGFGTGSFICDHMYLGDVTNVVVSGCIMGDCSDTGVACEGTQGAVVSNNVILGPDLQAVSVSPSPSRVAANVVISDNILGNSASTGVGVFCGLFGNTGDSLDVTISNNIIVTVDIGIVSQNVDGHVITGNQFFVNVGGGGILAAWRILGNIDEVLFTNNHVASAAIAVDFQSGAPTNLLIANNNMRNSITKVDGTISPSARFSNNLGYVTENKGTATVANGTTSIAVNHGLAETPVAGEVVVTPTNNPTNDIIHFWVDTYTSTQFTINVEADPGASTATFAWHAKVYN